MRSRTHCLWMLAAGLVALGCSEGRESGRASIALPQRPPPLPAETRYALAYSTYFGGGATESSRNVLVEDDGSVVVGLGTWSDDLPTTEGAFQRSYAGEDPGEGHWGVVGGDNFLLRLSPDGSRVVDATYLGGSKQERDVYGMLFDPEGNLVVTSTTRSRDMPTSPGAFQPAYGGGGAEVYVAKLSHDFRGLRWCTYIGGEGDDTSPGGLEISRSGDIYVVALTSSKNFPVSRGAFASPPGRSVDAAVMKLSSNGQLVWSARLGGHAVDAAVGVRTGVDGDAFVVGNSASTDFPNPPGSAPVESEQPAKGTADVFVARLNGADGALEWHHTIGGSAYELSEHRTAFDREGNVLVGGITASLDFPTTADAFQGSHAGDQDGFLAAVSPEGDGLVWATLLGGSGKDGLMVPTVAPDGSIFVVGSTASHDFPVTEGAFQTRYAGGASDGFLAVLSADGSKLRYSTYLGGPGADRISGVALAADGSVYLVGVTNSRAFPITKAAFQRKLAGGTDAFISKLRPMTN